MAPRNDPREEQDPLAIIAKLISGSPIKMAGTMGYRGLLLAVVWLIWGKAQLIYSRVDSIPVLTSRVARIEKSLVAKGLLVLPEPSLSDPSLP